MPRRELVVAEPSGNVTVAAPTLLALVRAALREVPGITGLAELPRHDRGAEAAVGPGAALIIGAAGVIVDCAVIAAPGARLVQLATTAQAAVTAALSQLAGIQVVEVNISIEDIAPATLVRKTRDHG